MPRKKSRVVTVEGREYRFMVRPWDDHGLVQVLIEDQEYGQRPLTAVVDPGGITATRGIGGPQAAALIGAGRKAGWCPETTKGAFALDDMVASGALVDDAEGKVRVRSVATYIAEVLRDPADNDEGDADLTFSRTDALLRAHAEQPARIHNYSPADLLGVARVTRPYADRLPSRGLYVAAAVALLKERGNLFVSDLLRRKEGIQAND